MARSYKKEDGSDLNPETYAVSLGKEMSYRIEQLFSNNELGEFTSFEKFNKRLMPSSSRLGSRKMIMIMIMVINMLIITINKSKVNATILKSWPILKDGSRGWKKLVYLWNASFVNHSIIGSWQSMWQLTLPHI